MMKILDFFKKTKVQEPASEPVALSEAVRPNGEKWPFGLPITQSTHIALDHYSTRQQARIAMQDSLHARSIVERFADTVVDTGLKLRPSPLIEELGISPEEANKWSRSVASRFHSFASRKTCSRDQSMNLYQAQRMAEVFQQRDNDYFVRFYYSKPTGRRVSSVQFQFIDADQVCGSGYLKNGVTIPNVEDGIQYDADGVEIGYMVESWNGKFFETKHVPAEAGGRVQMIHCYQSEYAGQKRGLSRLAHAVQEFSNLTDFASSHIQQAINKSSIAMTVESDTESPASNPFSDLAARRGAGPSAPIDMASATIASYRETNLQEDMGFYTVPEVTFQRPGSIGVFNLKGREKLKPFDTSGPSDKYDSFVGSFVSHLSASLSIPLEIVLMKFNQNYSASRAALILFWRVARIWQGEMTSDWLDVLYEVWLSEEIAAGRVSCPGFSAPDLRQAWLCATWRGQPMPNIDPAKTAEADKMYLEMGAQTFDDVAANFNGSDFTANVVANEDSVEKLPMMPWSKAAMAAAAPAKEGSDSKKPDPSEDPEEDTEDDEDK